MTLEALKYNTNGVGYEKRGRNFTPILAPDTAKQLAAIRSSKKRMQAMEALFHPFSIGAASVDLPEDIEPDAVISRADAIRIQEACSKINAPPPIIHVTVDGHRITFLFVLQIHPLVVETPQKRAYYPITTGFVILPEENEVHGTVSEEYARHLNPANWKAADRRQFWKLISSSLIAEKTSAKERQKQEERIISIQATVKTSGAGSDVVAVEEAIARMLETFRSNGQVIELKYNQLDHTSGAVESRLRIIQLLRGVEESATAKDKGESLEELMVALFETVPGFTVRQRELTATEEIDLVVLNAGDDARWRNDQPLILVECKNWSSQCGKNEIVVFEKKLLNRRGRCRLGFFISWNGYTDTVTKELLRSSQQDIVLVPLVGADVREAARTGSFLQLIQRAWDEAVMV